MQELTGRHVLAITLGFFATIIAVNGLLAYKAVATFPGLEVANSYVASQEFEAELNAQKALGWQLAPSYAGGHLTLRFTDGAGQPVAPDGLAVLVGRTTEAAADTRPAFRRVGPGYEADIALAPGKWMLRIEAQSSGGTRFRQRRDLFVKG